MLAVLARRAAAAQTCVVRNMGTAEHRSITAVLDVSLASASAMPSLLHGLPRLLDQLPARLLLDPPQPRPLLGQLQARLRLHQHLLQAHLLLHLPLPLHLHLHRLQAHLLRFQLQARLRPAVQLPPPQLLACMLIWMRSVDLLSARRLPLAPLPTAVCAAAPLALLDTPTSTAALAARLLGDGAERQCQLSATAAPRPEPLL